MKIDLVRHRRRDRLKSTPEFRIGVARTSERHFATLRAFVNAADAML
ncbi:hypothetical protein [uncultured Caballeronia sp.]